jgi:hypothetical protein
MKNFKHPHLFLYTYLNHLYISSDFFIFFQNLEMFLKTLKCITKISIFLYQCTILHKKKRCPFISFFSFSFILFCKSDIFCLKKNILHFKNTFSNFFWIFFHKIENICHRKNHWHGLNTYLHKKFNGSKLNF